MGLRWALATVCMATLRERVQSCAMLWWCTVLRCYAGMAMRGTELRHAAMLMRGTERDHAATSDRRSRYEMSGTDLAYGAGSDRS
eukprot:786383-Rhodomonas_salina.1